jgi:hypothetical protein
MRTSLETSTFFWDISPCGLMKVKQYFEGRYYLHLQGRRTSQRRNQHEARDRVQLILRRWRWMWDVCLQHRLIVRTLIHAWFINITWLASVNWEFLSSSC